MFDVIVIGGSYAGLAAALQLARARRRVLVIDAGKRRNRYAARSHGFLGQDGQRPEEVVAKGKADVLAYATVTWREATASAVRAVPDGFAVRAGNDEHFSKRLILATGVVDELPAIPGLAERWGKTVFHCPYCDGFELERGRIGVLATRAESVRFAVLASEWAPPGHTTIFLNGAVEPNEDELAQLASRAVAVERESVASVSGEASAIELHLRDGRQCAMRGLFVATRTRMAAPFAEQLGCELEVGPNGPFCRTDATKETTVPGVFACGDVALPMSTVAFAVADGTRAGTAAHQSLVFPR
jgi:thioredoxin reductase